VHGAAICQRFFQYIPEILGAATDFGYNPRVPETKAISSTRFVALLEETETVIDTASEVGGRATWWAG
jgi:hypothetical protein